MVRDRAVGFRVREGRALRDAHERFRCGAGARDFSLPAACLEEKLGPILWQLPPALRFDATVLEEFFRLLPRNFDDAAKLARGHAPRFADRVSFGPGGRAKLRYALEVRHPSFEQPEFIQLLRRHGVAPCVADSAGLYPQISDLTTTSLRAVCTARSSFTRAAIARGLRNGRGAFALGTRHDAKDAPALEPLSADGKPRPVFVYFDNDVKAHAPFDAKNLARALSGKRPLASPSPSVVAQLSEEPRDTWAAWRPPRAVRERREEAADFRRR